MSDVYPQLDDYRIGSQIGQGASATVFEATDAEMGRKVAIKVYDEAVMVGSERSLQRELKAMGRLTDHRNVVDVFRAGFTHDGRRFIAMALMEGGSLAKRIRGGPTAPNEVLSIGRKIGAALATAHKRGVVHCDIKPENILIDAYGEPHLGDFGIARVADSGLTITMSAALTPAYAAPEVLEGDDPSLQSDIYSFGATLAAVLNGTPATLRDTFGDARTVTLPDGTPPSMRELLYEMTDAEATNRPTAEQVLERLASIELESGSRITPALVGEPLPPIEPSADDTAYGSLGDEPTHHPLRRGPTQPPTTEQQNPTSPAPPGRLIWAALGGALVVGLIGIGGLIFSLAQRGTGEQPVVPEVEWVLNPFICSGEEARAPTAFLVHGFWPNESVRYTWDRGENSRDAAADGTVTFSWECTREQARTTDMTVVGNRSGRSVTFELEMVPPVGQGNLEVTWVRDKEIECSAEADAAPDNAEVAFHIDGFDPYETVIYVWDRGARDKQADEDGRATFVWECSLGDDRATEIVATGQSSRQIVAVEMIMVDKIPG